MIILLATLALAIPGLSQAQGPNWIVDAKHKAEPPMPTGPKAYVGAWSVGKDGEGAHVCTVKFNAAGVIGGYQLVATKACAKAVPRWKELYAWRVADNGDIVMADATRKSVYVFHKLGADGWATKGGDRDRLLLQRATKVGVSK
ncbi:MAG: AprI/Inh family metalloprotease inhibitor [Caulobacter sp.]|nr:AprI/Inh family metalloprotease inhibitor [Caulobacter sp.]